MWARAERPDRIGEDIARRLRQPASARTYGAQTMAALTHDCHAAVRRIRAPSLVVHGEVDPMVPYENAVGLASRVAGARLHGLADVGHVYTTEVPAADEAVAAFLAAT